MKSGSHWAKNINAITWVKPEEFKNLTKMAEHE